MPTELIVPLGGVQREAAPAAADVQQPHARTERQLAAHQVDLGILRGLQPDRLVVPDGAGVDHRRPEHQPVEVVADVVVVGDRGGIPPSAVLPPVPAQPDLLRRRGRLAADRAQRQTGPQE
jgi:hypothetical protein